MVVFLCALKALLKFVLAAGAGWLWLLWQEQLPVAACHLPVQLRWLKVMLHWALKVLLAAGAGWLWLPWHEKVAVAACHLPMLGSWVLLCWLGVMFLCVLEALQDEKCLERHTLPGTSHS